MDCKEEQTFSEPTKEILVDHETKHLTPLQISQRKYKQKPEVKAKYRNYLKKHYDEHKNEIQEKRKKKREEDPEYNELCKEINREACRKYREKMKLLKSQNKI